MASIKCLSKLLTKIYSDKKIMDEIISSSETVYDIDKKMAEIMKYYIVTRDNKIHSYQFISDRLELCRDYITNRKNGQLKFEAYFNNCIKDGVVTHSFNGFNLDKVKKYGLGDKRIFDEELTKNLEKLESELGSSEYINCQTRDETEIYYSGVGDTSFYYACCLAPERLYLGPLSQYEEEKIVLGESKYEFMMRVASKKIQQTKLNDLQKEELKKVAEDVISKFCTKKPVIALIPIQKDDFELNAEYASDMFKRDKMMPLSEYLIKNFHLSARLDENRKLQFDSIIGSRFDVFTDDYWNVTNIDNIVSRGVKVPPYYLNFVIVPDDFELTQRLAFSKGCKLGDKINYNFNVSSKILKINQKLQKNNENINKNGEKIENFDKKERIMKSREKLKKILNARKEKTNSNTESENE